MANNLAAYARILPNAVVSAQVCQNFASEMLPRAARGIFGQLKWKLELSDREERFSLADAEWGKLPDGHVIGKPVPLFPRIEIGGGA